MGARSTRLFHSLLVSSARSKGTYASDAARTPNSRLTLTPTRLAFLDIHPQRRTTIDPPTHPNPLTRQAMAPLPTLLPPPHRTLFKRDGPSGSAFVTVPIIFILAFVVIIASCLTRQHLRNRHHQRPTRLPTPVVPKPPPRVIRTPARPTNLSERLAARPPVWRREETETERRAEGEEQLPSFEEATKDEVQVPAEPPPAYVPRG